MWLVTWLRPRRPMQMSGEPDENGYDRILSSHIASLIDWLVEAAPTLTHYGTFEEVCCNIVFGLAATMGLQPISATYWRYSDDSLAIPVCFDQTRTSQFPLKPFALRARRWMKTTVTGSSESISTLCSVIEPSKPYFPHEASLPQLRGAWRS